MRNGIDPYSPCFCGSGKKYRFCCGQRHAPRVAANDLSQVVNFAKGRQWHEKGLRYMGKGKYQEAISAFRESIKGRNFIANSANNLALCLFITGKLDEAIQIQSQSFLDSPLPNPFGLSNLSLFFLCKGRDKEAENAVSIATTLEALNADATVKVCETLARFRRHRDILATADASDYQDDPNVRFFTGVAAANLGNFSRAINDLSCVPVSHPKAEMAHRYFAHLKSDTRPDSVRKDWPYLLPEEFYMSSLLHAKEESEQQTILSLRHAVDFAEAELNAHPDAPERAMTLLELSKHPEAVALLWLIAKGSFGSDQLRYRATQILMQRGEIQSGEEIELLHEGEMKKQSLFSIALNPEFEFCPMPPEVEDGYKKLVMAGHKRFANWTKIAVGYKKLIAQAPDFFPLRYNHAVALVNSRQVDEAEKILRAIVAEHPEYLFARSTLLTLLCWSKRMDEAEKMVKAAEWPQETHPDAYITWLAALNIFYEASGNDLEAFQVIKMAHEIAPDNPNVENMWSKWKSFNGLKL